MKELDKEPLEGGLNSNHFTIVNGIEALVRIPKRNLDLVANIEYEYRTLGFTGDGGRFRRRSTKEQHKFAKEAAMIGLMVLPPIDNGGDDAVLFPYLSQAQTLDEYMQDESIDDKKKSDIVLQIFTDLQKAHENGYIYGDRWAGNMLVHPGLGLVHIDFDLELEGRYARELELAQVMYHTIHAGGSEARILIEGIISYSAGMKSYDYVKTVQYLRGFTAFLADTPVGGISDEIDVFIDFISRSKIGSNIVNRVIGNKGNHGK